MAADPAVAVSVALMAQEVDGHPAPVLDSPPAAVASPPAPPPPPPPPPPPQAPEDVKRKTPGSSRRGKQYKCGNCHELGHNQKTCPRRAAVTSGEAAQIQPALGVDASELFGTSNVAPALPPGVNGHTIHHHLPIARLQPCKLEAALEAANKRVIAADKQVAASTTDADFEEATSALDSAVRYLEKVASCAQRYAMVAHTLSGGSTWETAEREAKRIRMDGGGTPGALTPTPMVLNDAGTGTAQEAVEGGEVVAQEGKEEGLE